MLGFDPRSFIIISALLGALCSFIFFVLGRSFPKDIKGLHTWAYACLIMIVSAFLFASFRSVPKVFSSFLANVLVVSGIMLMYISLQQFTGRPTRHRQLGLVLATMAILLVWPTFIQDNYRLRVILVSSVNTVLFFACAVVILRMQGKSFAEWFTQVAFFITASISFIRCIAAFGQADVLNSASDQSVLQHVYLATFSFSILALSLGFMLMVNRSLQLKLEYAASYDDLTGTFRRDAFFDLLEKEMARSFRYRHALSLLMIDLDNFKAINDQHGHLAGDRVIVDFSKKAQQALRGNDVIGRYGGEEFIVLLPNTSEAEAYKVADRIRTLSAQTLTHNVPAYTVSIGIATVDGTHEEIRTLVSKADQGLYKAKKAGKNRIEVRV